MDSIAARTFDRSTIRKLVEDLYLNSQRVFLVHYACESFDKDAATGSIKVTAIAVRNLKTAQTKLWSLQKSAEISGGLEKTSTNIDSLERVMLEEYFTFLESYHDCRFIHWNMRDDLYGFPAIEHRYRLLGGVAFTLPDSQKIDLSRVLWILYGDHYASNFSKNGRPGKIFSIVEMNKIGDRDALTGADEAIAFDAGEHLKIRKSLLRKLDIFSCIFDLAHRNKLKTNSSWGDVTDFSPAYIIEKIKNYWLISLLILTGSVAGAIVNWWKIIINYWQLN